jgi:DNA-directed RNA polymerase II subunit RPB2
VNYDELEKRYFEVHLGQAAINQFPRFKEEDERYEVIFPHEARLRNITYQSVIKVAVKSFERIVHQDGRETLQNQQENEIEIGKVPIMVRSTYCSLNQEDIKERDVKECEYDQGGYFIINGGEKVIVA